MLKAKLPKKLQAKDSLSYKIKEISSFFENVS